MHQWLYLPFTHNYSIPTLSFLQQAQSLHTSFTDWHSLALPHQLMTWRRIMGATEVAAQARYQSHGLPEQDRLSEAFF